MAQENEIKLIPKRRVQIKLLDSLQRDSMEDVVKTISNALCLSETYELTPRETESLHDVYYDTENADLFREQISLRVRFRGEEITVTVKQNRSRYEGTFRRDEDDVPCDQTTLQRFIKENFVEITRNRLAHLSGQRLVQMVTVKNSRRVFSMQPKPNVGPTRGFSAKLSFDMFTFLNSHGRSSDEMYELEIETLNAESESQLESVAANIRALAPSFVPSKESKYERGVHYFKLAKPHAMQRLDEWARNPIVTWTGWLLALVGAILAAVALR